MPDPSLPTWESAHQFYFKTTAEVTPLSLADNLVGLDGVLRRSGDVLGKILGLKVDEVEILLQSVELNSYKDSFVFRVFFGKGAAAEKKLDEIRKKLKLDNMDTKAMIGAIMVAVMAWAAWRFVGPEPEPKVQIHIENSFNNASEKLGITKEDLLKALDSTLGRSPEEVKKNVVKLAHPAGQEEGGEIVIDESDSLVIPEEIINAIPTTYEKAEPTERDQDYIKKDIAIRALDLDRPGSGWAAIAPDIHDGRLPLSIGEEVDPAKVPVGKVQSGDFTVTWRRDKTGKEKPLRIVLHRLHRN